MLSRTLGDSHRRGLLAHALSCSKWKMQEQSENRLSRGPTIGSIRMKPVAKAGDFRTEDIGLFRLRLYFHQRLLGKGDVGQNGDGLSPHAKVDGRENSEAEAHSPAKQRA
jgi:hypothetical protein